MDLLIVAATEAETGILKERLAHAGTGGHRVDILITGVGMLATAYALTNRLQGHKYDLALQAGVGGSFDRAIALGSLVFVTSDRYGDLGAEDHDDYLDIFDMGLMGKDAHPYGNGWLNTPLAPIHDKINPPKVSGITVNTVSGNERTIARRAKLYGGQVESMEGAAFHYVCLNEGVPFAQVRSISNYVTPRDKSQWRMKDAVINLNNWLIDFINDL